MTDDEGGILIGLATAYGAPPLPCRRYFCYACGHGVWISVGMVCHLDNPLIHPYCEPCAKLRLRRMHAQGTDVELAPPDAEQRAVLEPLVGDVDAATRGYARYLYGDDEEGRPGWTP